MSDKFLRSIFEMVIFVQPALALYRVKFFEELLRRDIQLHVFSSTMKLYGIGVKEESLTWATTLGEIRNICGLIFWQTGVSKIQLGPGDTLVVSGAARFASTFYLIFRAKLRGAKVIWWGHAMKDSLFKRIIYKAVFPYIDLILFYTDREVRSEKKSIPRKVSLGALNNGLDASEIRTLRSTYQSSSRANELLFIGRLTKKVDFRNVIRAISEADVPVVLHIIGDGEERDLCKKMAGECGVECRVIFHGPLTEEKKIAAIANRCLAAIYPGAVGLSLIHYMMYGLPVLIPDRIDHMPEFAAFSKEKSGYMYGEDHKSLRDTISYVIQEGRALNNSISRENVAITDQSYNMSDMANRFIRLSEPLTFSNHEVSGS